jgi:hypothetical protein
MENPTKVEVGVVATLLNTRGARGAVRGAVERMAPVVTSNGKQ